MKTCKNCRHQKGCNFFNDWPNCLIALIESRNSSIAESAKVGTMKSGQERTVHGKMKI